LSFSERSLHLARTLEQRFLVLSPLLGLFVGCLFCVSSTLSTRTLDQRFLVLLLFLESIG
jgi:hypothetical protein